VGVLLFALTQLQALVGTVRGGREASDPELEPFTSFLTTALESR